MQLLKLHFHVKKNNKSNFMNNVRLGINIDHIATLRNARGGIHPDILRSLEIVEMAGADGITAHLREDRRHIKDEDIYLIKEHTSLPLNMEMAATKEMLDIAIDVKPNACCLVPEKRQEITTEGGLDVLSNIDYLTNFCAKLKQNDIKVSLFIDPVEKQIFAAKKVGADIVELHTGTYCNSYGKEREIRLTNIIKAAKTLEEMELECHAGHGLCYNTVSNIARIPNMVELNIGHFLISESLFIGLEASISRMKNLIILARKEVI